jgi:hypothetical protein
MMTPTGGFAAEPSAAAEPAAEPAVPEPVVPVVRDGVEPVGAAVAGPGAVAAEPEAGEPGAEPLPAPGGRGRAMLSSPNSIVADGAAPAEP